MNYMARQPLFGMARMESLPLGDMRASDVLVLDLHEIVAGKLVALVDRHAARDLFDARRFLSIDKLDWNRIKAAVLAMGASGRRDWRAMSVDAIEGDPRELRNKLAPSACPATVSPPRERSTRGLTRPSRFAARGSLSCSI